VAEEGLRAFKRTTILGYEIPWNNFDFEYQWYVALEQRHVDLKIAARVKSQFDGLSSEMHGYLGQFETQQEREDAQQMVVNLIFMIDGYLFRAVVQRVLEGDREHMLDLLTDMWCGALHLGGAAD